MWQVSQICFKSEIEPNTPSYGPNFCAPFFGGKFQMQPTIEFFRWGTRGLRVSERVFAFFSNFDNLQLKLPVVTARHIHIQASEIEKYVVKAPCSLGQIRTNIGFSVIKKRVFGYIIFHIPSSMETLSSTSPLEFFSLPSLHSVNFTPPPPVFIKSC